MRRLAVRPGGIGDTLLGLPALEKLAAGAELTVWARAEVLPLLGWPSGTIEGSGLGLLGIEAAPEHLRRKLGEFDEIHTWYGANREEFREALSELHPRVSFYAALPPDETVHAADFFAGQVGAELPAVPRVAVSALPSRLIYMHPFSGSARKNWPLENYQLLGRWLESTGRPVQFLAAPQQHLPGARVFERLDELAVHVAGGALYIGNDTGITHLAAACGAPTLALFGPTSPRVWGPRGPRVEILHQAELERLSPEQVLDKALEMTGFGNGGS
jgi:ADP-heptose:LPS heptosyltransferase